MITIQVISERFEVCCTPNVLYLYCGIVLQGQLLLVDFKVAMN